MKEFKDYYNGELHEFRVINKAQRRKMALRLKKLVKSQSGHSEEPFAGQM
mgnify:CR=1 FL=1